MRKRLKEKEEATAAAVLAASQMEMDVGDDDEEEEPVDRWAMASWPLTRMATGCFPLWTQNWAAPTCDWDGQQCTMAHSSLWGSADEKRGEDLQELILENNLEVENCGDVCTFET